MSKKIGTHGQPATTARFAASVGLAALLAVLTSGSEAGAAPCIQQAFGGSLNCTANDIAVAQVLVTNLIDGCDATPGDTFTFDGTLQVQPTAQSRYDIGFYIGNDPLASTNSDCYVGVIDPTVSNIDNDSCGDTNGSTLLSVPVTNVTAPCSDGNGDGFIDINTCSSWNNTAGTACAGPADAVPGTKSKCHCEIVPTNIPVPHCEDNAALCDDGNVCTDDVCNLRGTGLGDLFGCTHPNNTAPCSDGLFCNGVDVCLNGTCNHPGDPCTNGGVCGNSCNEDADNCFVQAGTVCRSASGVCDVAETCTGSDGACPADAFVSSATVCRSSAGVCDTAESCTGDSADCPADAFVSSATVCRDSAGICDTAESCTGSSADCPVDAFVSSATVCRDSAGVCDTAENCTGADAACPSDAFVSSDTVCRGSAGVCDTAESCTGSSASCPADGFQSSATVCRGSAGICDTAENCSGDSAECPADAYVSSQTVCRGAAGVCDTAENCTGSDAACPADAFVSSQTVCRGSAGVCDVAESCTGDSAACPSDIFIEAESVCRASAGVCDVVEVCTGSSAACPADSYVATGTVCRGSAGICDAAENCTGDSAACPVDAFASTATVCRGSAGICDTAENCSGDSAECPADAYVSSQTVCRAAAGVCDTAENCTGSDAACPADAFVSSQTVCRGSAGVCDVAENCTGSDAACPTNGFVSSATVCRSSAGVCDTAESCTGSSASCPADGFLGVQVTCRASAGVCDTAETCSGSAASCPADSFKSSATTCRAAAGACDVAESCTGSGASCPADGFKSSGTSCPADSNTCTDDVCNGSGSCTHPNNTASCDDGLFCTVNDTCAQGQCTGSARQCGDEVSCTGDVCNEDTNSCQHIPYNEECSDENSCTTDTCDVELGCKHVFSCKDICRSSSFYAKRSGSENDQDNLVQQLLNAVGGVTVCGERITSTSNQSEPWVEGLGLSSALEGLCVRPQGVVERPLYKELVAARLNCAMSGSDDCDGVLEKVVDVSYSSCDALCAGQTALDGPGEYEAAVARCTTELNCYNSGGRLVGGKCALGTCDVTDEPCGAQYGACSPIGTVTFPILQTCKRFPGNCRDEDFCQESLSVCPAKTPASSSRACKEAKNNTCTIDNCPSSGE